MGGNNSKPCPPGPTVYTPGEKVYTPGPTIYTPGEKVYTPGPTVYTPGEKVYTPGPTVYVPCPNANNPGQLPNANNPSQLPNNNPRPLPIYSSDYQGGIFNITVKNSSDKAIVVSLENAAGITIEPNISYPVTLDTRSNSLKIAEMGMVEKYDYVNRTKLRPEFGEVASITFNPDTFKQLRVENFSTINYKTNGGYEIIPRVTNGTSQFGAMNNNGNLLMWIIIALIAFYFYKKSKGGNLFGKRRGRR